jgi:tRNA pseudouridine55 synthase
VSFDGIVLVDKPSGLSSHDVVAKARKIFQTKSVGHAGTLDPLASGLLVLLINEATKLSHYILEKDKSYEVEILLGETTDTLDVTGQVLSRSDDLPVPTEVLSQALKLQGLFEWPIPSYSAAKVNGEKLYEKARRGEIFEAPSKSMQFWDVRNLNPSFSPGERVYQFSVSCSKGSFIRSWVSQLGAQLGCGATMKGLRRTGSAPYSLEQALGLEDLESAVLQKDFSDTAFHGLESCLQDEPYLRVKGMSEVLLANGTISHDLRSELIRVFQPERDRLVRIFSSSGRLLALVAVQPGTGFKIQRIFNIASN